MTMPHRNDVLIVASLSPNHNGHTLIEITSGDKPKFAVLETSIFDGYYLALKHFTSACEIEVPVTQDDSPLRRIEGDRHTLHYVVTEWKPSTAASIG